MKLSSIAACLVFAAAALLPFQPWAELRESTSVLEVRVDSDHSGLVQAYFDTGRGLSEEESVVQPIHARHPALLRFALPYGTIKLLRFDPIDREARMILSEARVADASGRTLVSFSPEQFLPSNQIAHLETKEGKVYVETAPGGTDPQMIINLASPIVVPRPSVLWRAGAVFAALVAALLAFEWASRSPALRLGERARALWGGARARPALALLAASLLGTVGANYPVVFAGRSILSPSFGVALLYGQSPWLPGFESGDAASPNKSDVAALLWHHVPLSAIEGRALLRDGELPLWNRYDSAGSPLLGQGQSCFGDPLQLLPLFAGGAAWAWELKFLLAKWAFALGIGLCAWRCFRSLPVALVSAASIPFIGFFLYRINHPAGFSLCYAPWILYSWLRYAGAGAARGAILWLVALVGANWVEMCSGTAKEAYFLLHSMNFTGACVVACSARAAGERIRLLAGAVVAGGAFAMVSAPLWDTFRRALQAAYTSYNTPLAYQLQPGMFIGLFDEAFYRPFQEELGVINPSANAFVLVGLLWVAVRWRAAVANRVALGLLLSSLPALALAFGAVPPGLIVRIPVLGNIQHVDNTVSCGLIVIFGVLSSFGWAQAWERLGSPEGRGEACTVIGLLVILFAAYLGTAQAVVRSAYADATWGKIIAVPAFIHGYGWSLLGASALLLWVLRRSRMRGEPTPAMAVLALLAMCALCWREGLHTGVGFTDYVVRPPHRMDFKASSPTVEALQAQAEAPFRVVGFHNDLLPGWSAMYGLEAISGPDALVNPYYREFMDASGVKRLWDWRYIVEASEVARLKPVLDALNVRFYVGFRMGDASPGDALSPVQSSDMDTFESPTAWPRAFFTDSVAVYEGLPQFCTWLKTGDGRPFAAMQHADWVRQNPLPEVSGDLSGRKVVAATDYALTTDSTTFTVKATGPGFIVLTEAYERDNFRVTLNGEKAPYLRLNHAFKGVYVGKAGTYQVRFAYFPRGLWPDMKIAAAGLCLIALALLAALFAPKRAGRAPSGG